MSTTLHGLDAATVGKYEKQYVLHTWSAQKDYKPLVVTGAQGCYFWDDQGKQYLDFASQLINVNAGHQHPKIVQAIKDQAERLCYVLPSMANDQRALLAKMLADLAPGDLNKSFLVTGGAMANEGALKMARSVTGRQKVISRFRSYHGGTYGTSAVTGDPRRIAAEPSVPGSLRVWDPLLLPLFLQDDLSAM
jgi:taurine--2-oxoglutarate transaminase